MLYQTYGPTLVPGLVQKGLEPVGQSVSVSAVAPRCIFKPLHCQAPNSVQKFTMNSQIDRIMFTTFTFRPTCFVLGDLSLSMGVTLHLFNDFVMFCTVCKMCKCCDIFVVFFFLLLFFFIAIPVFPTRIV